MLNHTHRTLSKWPEKMGTDLVKACIFSSLLTLVLGQSRQVTGTGPFLGLPVQQIFGCVKQL